MYFKTASVLAIASLATAQTTVSETTTNSNPIQVTGTRSSVSLPFPLPTSFISSLSNHIPGTQSIRSGCTTITLQGEPMFSIQTQTSTSSGCTIAVYVTSTGTANDTTKVVPTFSSLPIPVAPGPVVTANNTMNGTLGAASSTGTLTSTLTGTSSSGAVGGGAGSGTSTTSGSGGAAGSSSRTSSASSSAQTSSPASANALLAGEGIGLAAVAAVFMLL